MVPSAGENASVQTLRGRMKVLKSRKTRAHLHAGVKTRRVHGGNQTILGKPLLSLLFDIARYEDAYPPYDPSTATIKIYLQKYKYSGRNNIRDAIERMDSESRSNQGI